MVVSDGCVGHGFNVSYGKKLLLILAYFNMKRCGGRICRLKGTGKMRREASGFHKFVQAAFQTASGHNPFHRKTGRRGRCGSRLRLASFCLLRILLH
ncbi:hypothetical protein NEIPOLOT_00843 [Neisseria polysaccharea ATCC 43768]|nr:hypothetical protein NEIPOLOT_00843 [Neisseria polysaccharea ATCC 43768]